MIEANESEFNGLILVNDKLSNTIDFVLATLHVIVTESREMPAAE